MAVRKNSKAKVRAITGFVIPPQLKKELKELAKRKERSMSFLVRRAIREYLAKGSEHGQAR